MIKFSIEPQLHSADMVAVFSSQQKSFPIDKQQFAAKAKQVKFAVGFEEYPVLCLTVPKDGLGMSQWLQTLTKAFAYVDSYQVSKLALVLDGVVLTDTKEQAAVMRLAMRAAFNYSYQYDRYLSSQSATPLTEVILVGKKLDKKQLERESMTLVGVKSARDLANAPANDCFPDTLAEHAKNLAALHDSLHVEVLDEAALEERGFGAFLAVSQGSDREGKLIIVSYQGASKSEAPHALVGKGVTFDTGGISLKPAAAMDEMKFDMCGAASVLGTMEVMALAKPAINVVGVVAAAENMPSGNATRPGDIVRAYNGKSIEVLNTDAEGRLVLCDALAYTIDTWQPKTIIDIATLTGACVIALGHHASACFSNDDNLGNALVAAGNRSYDRVWPMPLWDEYNQQLKSPVADLPNISNGRDAGSITAACFLSNFVGTAKWAHLDIAGTAWKKSANQPGATGRPVSLLVEYLLNLS